MYTATTMTCQYPFGNGQMYNPYGPRRRLNVRDPMGRFLEKVDKTGECWVWIASLTKAGYGQFYVRPGEGSQLAHKWLWEATHGPVPGGLELDHICRNRPCVNPSHLEPVTRQVNNDRGWGNNRKTHCPQGHPYDAENTSYRERDKSRQCKECNRQRVRRYHQAKRLEVNPQTSQPPEDYP